VSRDAFPRNFHGPRVEMSAFRGKPPAWVIAARAIRRAGATQPVLRYHHPMQRDYLSNPITVQRDTTLQGIDDFIKLLGYERRAERILAAADAEPESCLANVYAGLLWMLLEAPEGAVRREISAAAERARPLATRREQLNAAIAGLDR